jgi:hypothetical protein
MIEWRRMETLPEEIKENMTPVDLWAYDAAHDSWHRRPNCHWREMTDWAGNVYKGWHGLSCLHSDFQDPTHWILVEPPEDHSND